MWLWGKAEQSLRNPQAFPRVVSSCLIGRTCEKAWGSVLGRDCLGPGPAQGGTWCLQWLEEAGGQRSQGGSELCAEAEEVGGRCSA